MNRIDSPSNFHSMETVTIKYRILPTPGFQSEFTLINRFDLKHDDTIWFIKDQMIALYRYHPTDDFEWTILDVWAEIFDWEEVRKISWEDSDISDFSEFVKSIK